MNKKIICLLTSILIICSLIGCSKTESKNPTVSISDINYIQNETTETEWNPEHSWAPLPELFETQPTENTVENGEYTTSITMLDVGQGLSILIESDGEYLLYDGGGRNYSSYVVAYLQQHGINELKYMFTSHYDEDHINGLIGVMNTTKIGLVVRPDYTHNSKLYQSYLNMLNQNGAPSEFPKVGDTYQLGNATITVISPKEYGDDANENSIAINVSDGNFNCVITGDAEVESEEIMVASRNLVDCDLYVVGHHGSSSSSSKSFINTIRPEYAFISVGKGNSYGHPTQKTMDTLTSNSIQVFRSDIQDEVTCYTNGSNYWFNKEPCNDYGTGNNVDKSESTAHVEAKMYVLNTNSNKFHYPNCSSVEKMSEKNKSVVTDTRNNLINRGYSPCGICKP